MKALKQVLPSQVLAKLEQERADLNATLNKTDDKLAAIKARETLTQIMRLAPRLNAVWLGEAIALMVMGAWNLIDHDTHNLAGMYVYPTMLFVAMAAGAGMTKLDIAKELYVQQKNKIR